jgi:hypothetical protein
MLLTAFALSDDNLLSILRGSQVLSRVELSLHSSKVLAAQDVAWAPAWRAGYNLHKVLISLLPVGPFLVQAYSDKRVRHVWRDIESRVSILRGLLG